jgi:hypothetical protein
MLYVVATTIRSYSKREHSALMFGGKIYDDTDAARSAASAHAAKV